MQNIVGFITEIKHDYIISDKGEFLSETPYIGPINTNACFINTRETDNGIKICSKIMKINKYRECLYRISAKPLRIDIVNSTKKINNIKELRDNTIEYKNYILRAYGKINGKIKLFAIERYGNGPDLVNDFMLNDEMVAAVDNNFIFELMTTESYSFNYNGDAKPEDMHLILKNGVYYGFVDGFLVFDKENIKTTIYKDANFRSRKVYSIEHIPSNDMKEEFIDYIDEEIKFETLQRIHYLNS